MQRDAIILTMSGNFMREYTQKKFLQDMKNLNEIDGYEFWWRCKNLPKVQPEFVYLINEGHIRFRAEIKEFVRDQEMTFPRPDGGRKHFDKTNWIVFQGPVIEPGYNIPRKGFQGFRYTELIF